MLTFIDEIAVEAFTCLLIFKNIFSFIMTFFAYDWLVSHGIKPAFMAISSIQMAVCLLSIPMCEYSRSDGGLPRLISIYSNTDIFGKRNRSFFARHDFLKILHLR